MNDGSWIGVDFDGVLVEWRPKWTDATVGAEAVKRIGTPIPKMVEKVKGWLAEGKRVRILTARVGACGARSSVAVDDLVFADGQRAMIEEWCLEHLGQILPVTATKDWQMIEFYDDRCVQMVTNEGISLDERLCSIIQAREAQIMTLCSLVGAEAEEELEDKIRQLVKQVATLTEALEKAKSFNVRKFISEWSWESSHGPTLFHGEYHEKKQALEKFSQALVDAALAAVRGGARC